MFVVVLAQLERQPFKKRHFVNGCVPINVALVFLMVLFFFFSLLLHIFISVEILLFFS